jgi:PAS domain S-box-containing protein
VPEEHVEQFQIMSRGIEQAHEHPADRFLSGGGEMGERIRRFDWSKTVLGPVEDWPQSLRSAVSILLPSKAQIVLFWGPELITIYNDAYRPVLGGKHPRVLGLPARETWNELWTTVLKDLFEGVINTGEAYWASDRPFFMERFQYDYKEETFFDVSYDPVRDETGKVGGIFCIVSETTTRVLAERRLKTLRELSACTTQAKSAEDVCQAAARILTANRYDVPFASIYLLDSEAKLARLAASVGVPARSAAAPACIHVARTESHPKEWPLAKVWESGRTEVVKDLNGHFGVLPGGAWPESPSTAVVLPLKKGSGQDRLAGFLIAGVSPRRPLDDQYGGFFDLLANQIETAVSNARAYEEERKRAEALAELDRAKTTFFSNVSHEFRTPLTLMLGPLEEALNDSLSDQAPERRRRLEFAYRNSRRLLKLVNSLLDFARIEGGRMEATFEPTDLAQLTADLAAVFRAATEQAELTLHVDCPPLSQPVYVDRDMWEKIVLNLLSNAFKFTFEGGIAVTMREESEPVPTVLVRVEDTGTGIPEEQLASIFERFHRVPGAKGRSIEGTGIGLALVKQLVQLHGGTIEVSSVIDHGSAFTVRIPLGSSHLPQDRVRGPRHLASTATRGDVFVEEVLRWLPSASADPASATAEADPLNVGASQRRPTVLLADDNADMRAYVCRLLGRQYQVLSVEDGETALERILADPPDLVLADVMMPRLDGFGLVQALRRRRQTIPVILLSARADEESRIEGLERGADDYLIKPFSANELLARVGTHLDLAQVRREAEETRLRLQHELQLILDHAPSMIWYKDTENRILRVNRMAADSIGLPKEEIEGRPVADLYPADADRYYQDDLIVIRTGEPKLGIVEPYRLPTGERRWIRTDKVPMKNESGTVIGILVFAQDITEQKRADEALFAATAKFESLFHQSGIFAGVMDLDGYLREANDLSVNACGYRRDEVLNRPFWETPWWRVSKEVQATIRRATEQAAAGLVFRETLPYWWADGTEHAVDFALHPIRDQSGRVAFLHPTGIDVTDRKQAQDALAHQRRLYESILTTTPDLAYVFDLNHRFLYANEGLLKMWGKTWDEAIGKTCLELGYEPWHADMHDREIDQIIATKRPIRGEVPFTGTFGRRIYDYILTPVFGSCGEVIAVGGITRDVTDSRQGERALRYQSQQFETLLNQAPLGVYVVDADFRMAQINPLALPVFGDIPNLIGRYFDDVAHILWEAPYADELVMIFRHTLETGEPYIAPERIERRRDRGVIESYEWRVDRIVLPDGRFGVVCYFRDVSVQVLAREALRRSEDRLREFAAQLEQLVSERTQELVQSQGRLRALATELNLAEQRERKRLAAELHDHLQQMLVLGKLKLGQGMRLPQTEPRTLDILKQTDDVLGEALQYTRTLVAELSPPVLHEHGLAAGLVWLGHQMRRHDLAVNVRVPEIDLPLPEDQAVLLFQSVRELLINASKHANSQEAAIVLERAGENLRIEVSDRGVGFDVAALAASPTDTQSSKFGLFSIRERMKALGGTFELRSLPGQGTTAVLVLPVGVEKTAALKVTQPDVSQAEADAATEGPVAAIERQIGRPSLQHKQARVRLLLVDDHAMVREGLRSVLESYDDVEIVGEASNGEDALALVERLRPALVVMDINMPRMNGIEATSYIARTYPDIPVIGLSVNATGNNVQAMLKAGAVLLLTKEAAVNELYRRMREVLTMHAGSGVVAP